MASYSAALHLLKLLLELLDSSVGALKVLVEPVTLADKFLLPLAETVLFNFDLLGKSLPQALFLLLEFRVVELSWSGFAKLPGLHLLGSVGLVVRLLRGVNQIKHVGADQNRPELLKVAVIFVLNLGHTPRILTTFDNAAITSLDILLRADDGEWHGSHEAPGMLGSRLIILFDRWSVDLDALSLDNSANL